MGQKDLKMSVFKATETVSRLRQQKRRLRRNAARWQVENWVGVGEEKQV